MPVRIALCADASWSRQDLRPLFEGNSDFLITADEADPRRLFHKVLGSPPDLIALDIGLLGRGGLEIIEQVMAEQPVPILLLGQTSADATSSLVDKALKQGALALIDVSSYGSSELAQLRARLRQLAHVPVVRHLHHVPANAAQGTGPARSKPHAARIQIIGMGASMGGPAVLVEILSQLSDCPAAILVVQHLPAGFVASFADYLRARTRLAVELVSKQQPFQPSTVYLPIDDHHLVALAAGQIGLGEAPPVFGHRPSVDQLFVSLAEHYGRAAVGVILQGLGRDGSAGLLEMKKRGAITIAQAAARSTDGNSEGGMPGAARELGAVSHSLPVHEIAQTLLRICQKAER